MDDNGLEMIELPEMIPEFASGGGGSGDAEALRKATNEADMYARKCADLLAQLDKLRGEQESSSGDEESDDDEDLPFDDKHLLVMKFDKPGSLGLAYAPTDGNKVMVARIMPGSQAAKAKKKPKAGYIVCKIGSKKVYEVGYDKIMHVLKSAPRPVTITFGIPPG